MTKSGKHCGKRRNFCNYIFKKPPAAETSESDYMGARVKLLHCRMIRSINLLNFRCNKEINTTCIKNHIRFSYANNQYVSYVLTHIHLQALLQHATIEKTF